MVRSPRGVLYLVLPLLGMLHFGEARAQDRLVRTFGQEHGLAAPPVWALAQDSAGFLWIGAEGGLFRFDGAEIRRWAAGTLRGAVEDITVAPDGRIVVREQSGIISAVEPDGARLIELPPAALLVSSFHSMAFDHQGVLWTAHGGGVAYRDAAGGWQALPAAALQGEQPRGLTASGAGDVVLFTNAGLWRLEADALPRKVYASPDIVDVISPSADRLLVLEGAPGDGSFRLLEITPAGQRELVSPAAVPRGRPISLVERHGTVWLAADRFLVAARSGEAAEVLGLDGGLESGGPLLVDREGSLWLGSFTGLHQYPEPDTRVWGERDGLVSRHSRALRQSGNTIWVATWGGTGYLHRSAAGVAVGAQSLNNTAGLCTDAAGTVWMAADRELVSMRDTVVTRLSAQSATGLDCTAARDGGVWLGMRGELKYLDAHTRQSRSVPAPPGLRPDTYVAAVLHDSRDRVWIGAGDSICHASAARLLAADGAAWRCEEIAGLGYLNAMVELPDGTLWGSSQRLGILAHARAGWQPVPMHDLPTRTVFALVPSPRGGVWIAGTGILQRVAARADGGWDVLERLTNWHGVAATGGGDIVEEEDGTLWIATARGVIQVPAAVRFAAPAAPRVALVEARVDDRALPLEGALRLPHDRNRVELRFAALSFRDPWRLRHQVRLGPGEPWSESHGRPSFRFVDLPAREYRLEYRASLDGEQWTPEPLRFAFEVLPAWYRAPWFLALLTLLAGAIGWSAYRARVAYLLELERQRTRIAMDLHDEVGSGLASVGILSGVIAADGLDDRERRHMAAQIAASAEELGYALSDIVWSLDPHTATLPELAARLAEHGARLCARGDTEFVAQFPDGWPAEPLDVPVRRNVLLVGLEALHNAARHAAAQSVVLALLPQPDGGWALSVRDDGVGFAADSTGRARTRRGRGGHGLAGMRQRAAEIGALLDVRSGVGQGTAVTLRFGLRPAASARTGRAGSRLRRHLAQRFLA